MSHEAAKVFARREGLVQDVYVDLGDTVAEGQVLATLLPRGVEGESAAMIAQKSAELAKAQANYQNVLAIEQQSIISAQAALQEKEAQLAAALNTKETTESLAATNVNTSSNVAEASLADAEQNVKVAEQNVETIEANLAIARENAESRVSEQQIAATEANEQIELAVRHARQTAEQVVFDQDSSADVIQERDIPYNYGFRDQQSRVDFVLSLAQLRNSDDDLESAAKIDLAETMLTELNTMLENSTPGNNLTQAELDTKIQTIHSAEDKLAAAREKARLAANGNQTTETATEQSIIRLEGQLAAAKEQLLSAEKRVQLIRSQTEQAVETAKQNQQVIASNEDANISVLSEQIRIAKENVDAVRAAQKRNTDAARNTLNVLNAAFSAELATSGHIEITSPFAGQITKRNIEVGEMAAMQQAAFELIEVDSSLAEKTPTTIHFGVPENYGEEIVIGDEIMFKPVDAKGANTWLGATVTRSSASVDPQTRLYEVQAEPLEQIALAHNTTVRVKLITEHQPIFKVKSSLVKRENGENLLWILQGDSPEQIGVHVLSEDGEWAHVTGNITAETNIITNPHLAIE